jgi:hypothetical protein
MCHCLQRWACKLPYWKSGILTLTNGKAIMLRIYEDASSAQLHEMEIEQVPVKLAVSANDHYVGLKFGTYVRILDVLSGSLFHHKLPSQTGRCGANDHLLSFSTDCLSFIASTRSEPEKVISYYCECQSPANGNFVESSAPYVSLPTIFERGLSVNICLSRVS